MYGAFCGSTTLSWALKTSFGLLFDWPLKAGFTVSGDYMAQPQDLHELLLSYLS